MAEYKNFRKQRLNSPKLRQFPSLCPGDWKAPGCASWFKDPAVGGVGEERDAAAEGDDGQEHEGGDQDSCHTGRTASQQGWLHSIIEITAINDKERIWKCVFNICQEFLVRFEPVLQVLLMRVYIPYVQASTENAEAFDRLNRRLDNEVKNFTAMVKEVAGFIVRVELTLT